MTTKNFKYLAMPAVLALALTGCFGSSSPDERVVVPPDPVVVGPEVPDALAVVVNGNVFDVDSVGIIETATITFRENGAASESIATVDGDPITQLVTEDGSFSFTLRDGASPDSVRLLVTADGYFTKRFDIDFTTDEEEIETQLGLLARESDDTADAAVEDDVANASTTDAITASAESENAGGDASVPQGTQLLTASGDPITGTSVSLRVGAVNPNSSAMGASVPAGLNSANATEVAVPVGVVDVTMSDNTGASIKQFSNPITIGVRLPVSTEIPGGARTITTGDEFDVSSFDEDTGEWSNEDAKAVVGQLNAAGTAYRASFETNHLTFFGITGNEPVCTQPLVLSFSEETPIKLFDRFFASDISDSGGSIPAGVTSATIVSAADMASAGVTANATARLELRSGNGDVWYDSEVEIGVCGTQPEIDLVNPNPEPVTKVVSLVAVCSNDTTVRTDVPGASVRFRATGSGSAWSFAGGDGEGGYTFGNLNGTLDSYDVRVNPRIADVFNTTITPSADDDTIEFNVQCAVVTGTGS